MEITMPDAVLFTQIFLQAIVPIIMIVVVRLVRGHLKQSEETEQTKQLLSILDSVVDMAIHRIESWAKSDDMPSSKKLEKATDLTKSLFKSLTKKKLPTDEVIQSTIEKRLGQTINKAVATPTDHIIGE